MQAMYRGIREFTCHTDKIGLHFVPRPGGASTSHNWQSLCPLLRGGIHSTKSAMYFSKKVELLDRFRHTAEWRLYVPNSLAYINKTTTLLCLGWSYYRSDKRKQKASVKHMLLWLPTKDKALLSCVLHCSCSNIFSKKTYK